MLQSANRCDIVRIQACEVNIMGNIVLGSRIKARRKELDLTLQNIADEIGVAKSTIQRYENGNIETIKLPVVEAIARVLKVNPSYLLGKTDNKEIAATEDDELQEYLEYLKNREDGRMLFSLAKNATKEDVMRAVAIIEALKKEEERQE